MSFRSILDNADKSPDDKKAATQLSAEQLDAIAHLYNYTKRLQILWDRQSKLSERGIIPMQPLYKYLTKSSTKAERDAKNNDYFDHRTFLKESPISIRTAAKAFNEHYEQVIDKNRASTELMSKLEILIKAIEDTQLHLNARIQGRFVNGAKALKINEQYVTLFHRLCPELEIFKQRHCQEISAQDNNKSIHAMAMLDWKNLKQMRIIALRLRDQIEHQKYSLNSWTSTEEDITAESSTEIVKQIELFNRWFSDEQIRVHHFADSHIACRRANQDFIYIVDMLTATPALPRLKKDIQELKPFFDTFNKKCHNTLVSLRSTVKRSYEEYLESLLTVKKLRQDAADAQSNHTTKTIVTTAVAESLNREDACKNALNVIKSKLKYTTQPDCSLKEEATFKRIIQIINETKPIPITRSATIDAKLTLPSPAPELNLSYRPIESLLNWVTLEEIQSSLNNASDESKPLLIKLQEKSYTSFGSVTAKERERLTLIHHIKSFNAFFAAPALSNRGLEALSDANESLVDLVDRIKLSPELESDSEINSLTKALFDNVYRNIRYQVCLQRAELAIIESSNKRILDETQQLQQMTSKIAGTNSESVLTFYIKQACQEQLTQPKPYEEALKNIVMLVYLLLLSEEAPKSTLRALTTYGTIFDTANEAVSTPVKPKNIPSNSGYKPL
jgi:hypothetical protein